MKNQLIKILQSFDKYQIRYLKNVSIDGLVINTEEVYGGFEGSGEEHWIVIKVQNGENVSFWEIPGYYMSYDGSTLEIENLFEVEPKEKTVIIWQKK